MLNQTEFAEELQKLMPGSVQVVVRGWSDTAYGGREAVIVLKTDHHDEKPLCTILPLACPLGMYVGCTAPDVLRSVGIEFDTEPRPDHTTVLKVGDATFLLTTKTQREGHRWALLAERV